MRLQQQGAQRDGERADDDEGGTVRSYPPETFPPRLTMMVTLTDRLTGASTDRSRTTERSRGKSLSPSVGKPRESVMLLYGSPLKLRRMAQLSVFCVKRL